MKKIISLAIVLLMVFTVFSCGDSNNISNDDETLKEAVVGTWELAEDSSSSRMYPRSPLEIKANGKFSFKSGEFWYGGDYYIKDGIMVIDTNYWSSDPEYKVSIENGRLKLQCEEFNPVYYERAN